MWMHTGLQILSSFSIFSFFLSMFPSFFSAAVILLYPLWRSHVVVLSVAWKCSLVLLQGETVWRSRTERLADIVADRAPISHSLHPNPHTNTKHTHHLPWTHSFGRLVTCFHLYVILSIWYPCATVEKYTTVQFFTSQPRSLYLWFALIWFLQLASILHPSCFKAEGV